MSDSVEESPATADSGTLVEQYEALFQHRFSDCDPEFMETVQKPTASPPCVENWYTRPKRTFDWSSRSQHDQRGGGGYQRSGRSYNDSRERSDSSNNRGRPWRDYGNRGGGYGNRGGYGGGQDYHRDSDPDRSQHGRVHYAGMRREQDDHDERQPKHARRDER